MFSSLFTQHKVGKDNFSQQHFRKLSWTGVPPWYQSSWSPLIYLVGLLAISDPHINICVGPPNTCIALKQFHLLLPNTLFWSNFIYYPQRFEAKTLGWIKNFGITLTETDKLRLESQLRLLLTVHPEFLNSRVGLYFPCDLNQSVKFIF